MEKGAAKRLLDKPVFNSRIKSANVQNSERWLGYFAGPAFVMTMFYICGQSYLNQFYTDVLKMTPIWGGLFLTLLPIVSKIIDAITNIVMGQLVDRTRTKQGKARPWLLLSAPLLTISGILLFIVPTSNQTIQIIWVMISYNLYFCLAFTMYNISHTLMVPLSTRNAKQRDTLAMLSSMGQNMLPGAIVSLLFPALILPMIGVDQGKWITVMAIIAILALPAVFLEYYFTKERVTEDEMSSFVEQEKLPLGTQVRACLKSRYWIAIMAVVIVYQLYNNFQVTSNLYFANWVLGTYNDGVTMTLMNAVGQAPLGFGVIVLWPLVRKFGKRNVMIAGMACTIAGCMLGLTQPHSMSIVLIALFLKSFGQVPITYILLAMVADSLDHVEWVNHFRCDGFSASIYSIILTVTVGISTGIFNLCLGKTGYAAPSVDGTWVAQNAATQTFFTYGLFLVPAVMCAIGIVILIFYRLDKELPTCQKEIVERHKAEAEARGEVYRSPEEIAAAEQKESDRLEEQKRVEELKAKCRKKGLNYDEEEAKYQAKLAEKKRKAEAKKKK